jgi:glycosyltransferase involved in cell wall biosynthesis
MNISFLTSGHEPFDDRIFYHIARTLSDHHENVEIVSSRHDLIETAEGIRLNCFAGDHLSKREKIRCFYERLSAFKPEVIICSEPITLLASRQYSKRHSEKIRVIYDITEWYPSKKNLEGSSRPVKWMIFLKLLIFNFWIAGSADSFIFGEWYKSRPYRLLFPLKSFIYIPYYPDLKYISWRSPEIQPGLLRLSYSGRISREKGYCNFFKVIQRLSEKNHELKIEVNIVGWYENPEDKPECENAAGSENPNITVRYFEKQGFRAFTEIINNTDIFLDLRSDDFENRHCLPIKLFYYAALGRAVIFTDLKAIRKEVDIEKFGFLINPEDYESIADIISKYLNDSNLYYEHCRNARLLSEKLYNWQTIEAQFIKYIFNEN